MKKTDEVIEQLRQAIPLGARDLALERHGPGDFSLQVGDITHKLSADGFAKLCRIGNAYKHEVSTEVDSGPPYVVHVEIPYETERDQRATHWQCPVSMRSREKAFRIIPLLSAELKAMGLPEEKELDYYLVIELLAVPEDKYHIADLEPADTIADAMADFRFQVASHSGHSPDDAWFQTFGLDEKYGQLAEKADRHTFYRKEEEAP